MANPQKVRRIVLTGSIICITIAGTLYGAGLKTEREATKSIQKSREATIDERIQFLQASRANLTAKKQMVERQIRDVEARIGDKKQKGIDIASRERPREG